MKKNEKQELRHDLQQFEHGEVNVFNFGEGETSDYIVRSVQKLLDSNVNNFVALRGTHNQAHRRYEPNSGKQYTAMAVSSLAMLFVKHPRNWDTATVDAVLSIGDDSYSRSLKFRKPPRPNGDNPNHLLMSDVASEICVNNNRLRLDKLVDYIGLVNSNFDGGMPTLAEALEDALKSGKFAVVICNGQSVAVSKLDNKFHMFDSHCRNELGLSAGDGTACLTSYDTLEALMKIWKHNILKEDKQDCWYDLTSVNFNMEIDPPGAKNVTKRKPTILKNEQVR